MTPRSPAGRTLRPASPCDRQPGRFRQRPGPLIPASQPPMTSNPWYLPTPLRDYAMRLLDGLPGGDRLCHSDYHPSNLLLAAGRTAVIDWAGAARGVPEADHARTLLLLRRANPAARHTPADASVDRSRAVSARPSLRTDLPPSSPPLPHVDRWLLQHAAAQLSEGIPANGPSLTGLLTSSRTRYAAERERGREPR